MLYQQRIVRRIILISIVMLCGIMSRAQHVTDVRAHGALADGKTDDSRAFQRAIVQAQKNGTRKIFVPKGHYLIARPIKLPSYFTLEASPDAYIELKPSCNQCLLQNEDLVNGNAHIKVTGGKWNGNGWTQTRTIRSTVDSSDFCFGMLFYKVRRLEVGNLQIDSTRSWGIAYMECDTVHIHDIRFQQNPFRDTRQTSALMQNGDGVTGGGNHVLIENISGFTNDDLVAFAAGGASFQGKMSPFPAVDYHDVTVRNISPENIYDSIPALKAVAFYTFENRKVSNIMIEKVHGNTAMASVLFYSLFGKTGYFSSVTIRDVSGANVYGRSTQPQLPVVYGIISVKQSVMDRLDISQVSREEDRYANPQFLFDENTVIDSLNINQVDIRHRHIQGNLLLQSAGAVIKNSRINGVSIQNRE
ncbi:glycosyl hydrolase family 28-related protein [Chitinophaga sp. 22536]|uniref:glycosyl hydrolase family 28-related protein n=1 Tax=unclassified Chitinophaga TaxID=2619133 RepID=UPI003F8715E8